MCVCVCVCALAHMRAHVQSLSCAGLFATLWTVAHQALSVGLYTCKNTGMGCHFLLQVVFPTEGLNHISCIAGRFFTAKPWGKPTTVCVCVCVCVFVSFVILVLEKPDCPFAKATSASRSKYYTVGHVI